jgi:cytochrome c5
LIHYARLWSTVALALLATPAWTFTAEQVDAGRNAFELTCATCHGATLRQLPNALLAGPEFVARWGDRTTDELIRQVRSQMPPESPGGLPRDEYAAIIAYVLQTNGAVPNGEPLTTTTGTRIGDALPGGGAPVAAEALAAGPASTPEAEPASPPATAAPLGEPDLSAAGTDSRTSTRAATE